ncbi:hypothetical protein [Nocardia sp. NPDC058705]|uniref:DUF7373 family lipoprotein n=1 Tax=Nocardia sp. NPDC058705 TaxID=3346609 RepID=UPI0036972944
MLSRIAQTCVMATIAIVATGCGSTVSGTETAGEIDVRTLDVAKYPVEPIDTIYEFTPSMRTAQLLAANRLASSMALGTDIDTDFKYGAGSPLTSPSTATLYLSKATRDVLKDNKMLFGWASGSTDQSDYAITSNRAGDHSIGESQRERLKPRYSGITVLQFADEETAQRVAKDMSAADFAVAADQNQAVALPNYSSAASHRRPGVPTLGSTLAHGRYVIYIHVGVRDDDVTQLITLAEKTYRTQISLLDKLPALSPADMLRLPPDPDGMLRRALNPKANFAQIEDEYFTVDKVGFYQLNREQQLNEALYSETGADRFTRSWGTELVRTRDDVAAETFRDKAIAVFVPSSEVADSPPQLPDTKCAKNTDPRLNDKFVDTGERKRFLCAVQYRRYVAVVEADQIQDAHQRAAAQYALLANSQIQ